MARMIPLARNTVTWSKSLHVLACFNYNTRIAIACVPGEPWMSTWLAPVYVIVCFCTHTYGCILVSNEYTIIRHRRKIIILQFNLTETCIDQSL